MVSDALPTTPAEWMVAAKKEGVHNIYPDGLKEYKSGSDLLWKQYLLLRAYWEHHDIKDLCSKYFLGAHFVDEVDKLLGSNQDWRTYKSHLEDFNSGIAVLPTKSIGLFHAALESQRLCEAKIVKGADAEDSKSSLVPSSGLLNKIRDSSTRRSEKADAKEAFSPAAVKKRARKLVNRPEMVPSSNIRNIGPPTPLTDRQAQRAAQDSGFAGPVGKASNASKTSDEQNVNFALVNFIQAIIDISQTKRSKSVFATAERKGFKFADLWQAQTDGFIFTVGRPDEIHAIFECKRNRRLDIEQPVRQQEAGEMACWLYQKGKGGEIANISIDKVAPGSQGGKNRFRRLLIAQDCDEVWIIISEYTDHYLKYLRGKAEPDGHTFLRMLEFGPFHISRHAEMQFLAVFLLGFIRRQEHKLHIKQTTQEHRKKIPDTTGLGGSRSSSRSSIRTPSPKSGSRSRPDTPAHLHRQPGAVGQTAMRTTQTTSSEVTPRANSSSRARHRHHRSASETSDNDDDDVSSSGPGAIPFNLPHRQSGHDRQSSPEKGSRIPRPTPSTPGELVARGGAHTAGPGRDDAGRGGSRLPVRSKPSRPPKKR